MTGQAMAQQQIDHLLRGAVKADEVPGVVAMAATADGPIYQDAFGVRELGAGPAMTLDTVFRIASMTKAITSVAAMQLVERGKLALDAPVPDIDPALARPQVLEGFDGSGGPIQRPASRPITLRHLLTHTAGFVYEVWNADALRYVEATGTPRVLSGRLAALQRPLAPSIRANAGSTASTPIGSGASSRRQAVNRSTPISATTSLGRSG